MELLGIVIGVILALLDAFTLPFILRIHKGEVPLSDIYIPMIAYAFAPVLFLIGLNYTGMTVLNVTWDLASDVLITFIGIFIIKEHIGYESGLGLVFAFIAILLFLSDIDKDKKK